MNGVYDDEEGMHPAEDISDRVPGIVNTITRHLAVSYVLAATAPDQLGVDEADDKHRAVLEALTRLARDNPRLIAETVIYLLDVSARQDASQIVAAARSAQFCLDDPATMPADMRARGT